MMKLRPCELCNAQPSVFCPSDAAFLCRNCDAKVHQANFLVARHVRRLLCSTCHKFTGDFISGAIVEYRPSYASCPSENVDDLSSSVRISSTNEYSGDSATNSGKGKGKGKVKEKGKGVFVNWCGKLGGSAIAVEAACRALDACVRSLSALPFRVCLAASMWLGLRLSLDKSALTWTLLKRLEHISGVPAKIILAAESKLPADQMEEGWAES